MIDPETMKVFCGQCNRYTDHIIHRNLKYPKSHRCKLCDTVPTIPNLKYAEELVAEDKGDTSAHPHFLHPLFKYGQVCLLRNRHRVGYAHCKIYGMRYVDVGELIFSWEYYVIIHGEKEFQWILEENLNPILRPITLQDEFEVK